MHLQTWYNPNATDSTKHQIDHVLFRRRDIKAVQDTRVFRGADSESDHRLMVCKLRLKFRKPAKHTFHPRLQLAPLHSEAGKEAFQLSLQGLLATPPHPYWGCGAQLGSPQRLPQHYGTGSAKATSKATETLDLRGNAPPRQQQEQAVASFTGQPYPSGQGRVQGRQPSSPQVCTC